MDFLKNISFSDQILLVLIIEIAYFGWKISERLDDISIGVHKTDIEKAKDKTESEYLN